MRSVLVIEMSFLCSVIEDNLSEVVDVERFIFTWFIDLIDFDEPAIRVLPIIALFSAPCMHFCSTIWGHDVEDVQ